MIEMMLLDILEGVRDLAQKRPNNVYEKPLNKDGHGGCYYHKGTTSDGEVGCILGQAMQKVFNELSIEDISADFRQDMMEFNGFFGEVLYNLQKFLLRKNPYLPVVPIDLDIWANDIQRMQDDGYSWGRALKEYPYPEDAAQEYMEDLLAAIDDKEESKNQSHTN